MIRISNGPIRISTIGSDRWGARIKYWSVNGWAYLEADKLEQIQFYESPLPKTTDVEILKDLISRKMKALNSYHVVHQFNAQKGKNYYRMVAVMNNESSDRIRAISWIDAYVKYPVYSAICKIANRLIKED